MYLCLNNNNIIEAASHQSLNICGKRTVECSDLDENEKSLIGKKFVTGPKRDMGDLRIAVICNWGDCCGIATYTEFLINSLRPKVGEITIFAEDVECDRSKDEDNGVTRCWKRGDSMIPTIKRILESNPDLVFVQHEFGIFPKATHFLKMLEMLSDVPYVITTHSVYEHLDKTVSTAYIKNLIVHSQEGKDSLLRNGYTNNVYVVPHGCVVYKETDELWNTFQNEYTVIQFGFGFEYKGVDLAIDAIHKLKQENPMFKDIFYCYMCSESNHTKYIQKQYYTQLHQKVEELDLDGNVVILRGYLSEQYLCNFLRTAKLAIFPYKNNPGNVVYAASGAIRKAMANGVPTIASDSHLFDDLEGVMPRPETPESLAEEIALVFNDWKHREEMRRKNLEFVNKNNWSVTADKHLEVFQTVLDKFESEIVRVRV